MKNLSTLIRRRDSLMAEPADRTAPTPAAPKAPASDPQTASAPPVPTTAEQAAETDRRSLYEVGTLRRLSEGASLLDRSTNTDANKWHLVLSGSVRIAWVDSGPSITTTLQEGQWLGPSANAAWSAEADAAEPCRVLEFGRAAFEQLPAKIQLDAYRSLTEALGDGNRLLRAGRASLEQQVEATRQRLRRKPDDYMASPLVREFLESVPKLPSQAGDLITRLNDDSSRVSEIVDCVRRDPSLAGMVLRVANSAGVAPAYGITDVQRACLHIGHTGVYRLVVQSALETMAFGPEDGSIQTHSHLVSMIAYETALIARQNAQLAATIGLLHDVGRSAGAHMRYRKHRTAWIADLIDASSLGARLLESWQIPEKIVAVVERQDIPEYAPPEALEPEYRMDLAVLYVAHASARRLEGESEDTQGAFSDEYLDELGLGYESVEAYVEEWIVPKLGKERRLSGTLSSLIEVVE